jgi:hypothetical protein
MAARLLNVQGLKPVDEYLIWRRANTLFMGEWQPGCSGEGLAMAAKAMGLDVVMYECAEQGLLIDDHLSELKTKSELDDNAPEIMQMMMEYDREAFEAAGGKVVEGLPNEAVLKAHLDKGDVLLALVIDGLPDWRTLHWVTVVKNGDKIMVLNPYRLEDVNLRVHEISMAELMHEISFDEHDRGAVLALGKASAL